MKNALYILLIFACVFVGFSIGLSILENGYRTQTRRSKQASFKPLPNGEYKYNPNGPHGPPFTITPPQPQTWQAVLPLSNYGKLLAFALLPFSLLIMALYILFSPYVGRMAAWGACAAFCLSATASIYSVYFVQEIIFAAAILALAQAVWKFALKPSALCAAAIGIFAAAARSTKETAAIAYQAILLALAIAASLDREMRKI
ncbi:MAG: hypothetical protein ACLUKN_09880 [Bacilli bacterium]